MKAYCKVVLNTKYYGKGLEWDAENNVLSTPGVVTAHPEITLIQFLLENGCVEVEAYIACSRLPCYASVRYVEAVNKVVKPTFTLRTTNPDWCRLDVAEPWILPQETAQAVVSKLKEEMLRDLACVLHQWRHRPFQAEDSDDEEDEYHYDHDNGSGDSEVEEDGEDSDDGERDDDESDDNDDNDEVEE